MNIIIVIIVLSWKTRSWLGYMKITNLFLYIKKIQINENEYFAENKLFYACKMYGRLDDNLTLHLTWSNPKIISI